MTSTTIELEQMLRPDPARPGRPRTPGLAGHLAPSLLRLGRRVWAGLRPYCNATSAGLATMAAGVFTWSLGAGLLASGVALLLSEFNCEKTS